MCGGEAVLTVADALTKATTAQLSTIQILGVRSIYSVFFVIAFCLIQRSFAPIVTAHPLFHILRAFSGIAGAATYLLSLKALPLGVAVAVALLTPVFCLFAAIVFFRERLNTIQAIAVFGAVFGALLLVLRPSAGLTTYFGVGMGLLSSVLTALTWVIVPMIGQKDHVLTFIFFLNVGGALLGLGIEQSNLLSLTTTQYLTIALIAVLAMLGQLLVVQAFRCGKMSFVAPFRYSDLIYALTLGYVVWGEIPELRAIVGAGLLALSGAALLSKRHSELLLSRTNETYEIAQLDRAAVTSGDASEQT
jgi:drug/metabolite transporter (DMT)-like permease